LNALFVIALIALTQGMLMVVVLISLRDGNRRANQLLASYISIESLRQFLYFWVTTQQPNYFVLGAPLLLLPFLAGPCLYLYVHSMTSAAASRARAIWWHMVPVLLVMVALLWLNRVVPESAFADALRRHTEPGGKPGGMLVLGYIYLLGVLCQIGYAAYCFSLLRGYSRRIEDMFSATEHINLNWLRWFLLAVICINTLGLLPSLLRLTASVDWPLPLHHFAPGLGVLVMVYFVSLMSMRQSPVFSGVSGGLPTPSPASGLPERIKYQASSLSDQAAESNWQTLQELLQAESLYLQPSLSLKDLAGRLGLSSDHLTQVINQYSGSNFYGLINRFRIEKACQLIAEKPSNYPVSNIGYDVGFNSDSTFYRQFKLQTSQTPASYKKQLALAAALPQSM